ncbi:hypothetical protein IT072_19835 [Leifsonia sp. ZF2019]|uniref:hypothetical protein n=1 Tax=Leifsonia sp. ZF2019 TaxID=2781978 RepID=UPI001CBFC429|nr:hypothetical protein [Leifsonia sp. ZF2019]UAJ79409.1 hypothetical protein IT072_19835 [Leifsonia sp. ZF2019]
MDYLLDQLGEFTAGDRLAHRAFFPTPIHADDWKKAGQAGDTDAPSEVIRDQFRHEQKIELSERSLLDPKIRQQQDVCRIVLAHPIATLCDLLQSIDDAPRFIVRTQPSQIGELRAVSAIGENLSGKRGVGLRSITHTEARLQIGGANV